MNKNRTGAIVERVVNEKTKREGVVRLDKRRMIFFSRIPDGASVVEKPLYFEDANGTKVRGWLEQELAKADPDGILEWVPIVRVQIRDADRWGRHSAQKSAGFSVSVDRVYVALTKDQTEWVQLPWEECDPESSTVLDDEHRIVSSKNFGYGPLDENGRKRPDRMHGDRTIRAFPHFTPEGSYLPYTPELWSGLLAIVETVNAAEAQFRRLVETKDGLAELVDNGLKRLAAGPIVGSAKIAKRKD